LASIILILAIFAILMLVIASQSDYSSHAHSNVKPEELRGAKKNVASSPQFRKGIVREDDIGNLPLFLLKLQEQQQGLKVEVDKELASIAGLEQSLNSIMTVAQRLDRVISGAQSKGALGEQIIGQQLALLPPEWIARNEKFADGKIVEFCLRAPNGQLVPIDSKWTATELLDQLGQTTDKAQRDVLIRRVKSEVYNRAKEVLKYLDKHRTMGFCIAAVPDPVFEYCLDVQPRLVAANIVLISYSLLVPYLLLIVKLFWSSAQSAQALQISHVLNRSILQIGQIQQDIDTQVRGPLDVVKLQQSQYLSHNQQLQAAYTKLNQIQNELNAMQNLIPNGVSALPHAKIASIPDTLQHRLTQVREDLFEGIAKHNGHNP